MRERERERERDFVGRIWEDCVSSSTIKPFKDMFGLSILPLGREKENGREREKENGREREREGTRDRGWVRETEEGGERERERKGEAHTYSHIYTLTINSTVPLGGVVRQWDCFHLH